MQRYDIPSVCTAKGGPSGQYLWLTYDKNTLIFCLVLVNSSFRIFSTCDIIYLEREVERKVYIAYIYSKWNSLIYMAGLRWHYWLICRPHTAKSRVRFQACSRTDSIGRRDSRTSFCKIMTVFTCHYYPTNPLYS